MPVKKNKSQNGQPQQGKQQSKPKSEAQKSKPKRRKRPQLSPEQREQFDKAFELFRELVDLDELDEIEPSGPQTVFTSAVVVWMLIYQRLNTDASLEATVKHLVETMPQLLPDNKRVRERTLSENTGGYSQARQRLSDQAVDWLATRVSRSLIDLSPPWLGDRRMFVVDGTSMTLAPEKELKKAFPAASNQHGTGVWPVALLTVLHELASGCALLPEVGAMYGANAVSETALAISTFSQLPAGSIVLADSAFGIFSVAHALQAGGHDLLFRMTKQRFNSLRKQAELQSRGEYWKTYAHRWTPTSKDRRTNPELPADAEIPVHLHEIEITGHLTLYLVTTLDEHANTLADIYERREDVEIDIRNLKVVLDTENIRARSVAMFHKELKTSVVAYNLVSQFRRQAAELNGLPPRRMSFKKTWTTLRTFLLRKTHSDPAKWRASFEQALYIAMGDKLPVRNRRKYKRESYHRRPKCTQFHKREIPASKILPHDVDDPPN